MMQERENGATEAFVGIAYLGKFHSSCLTWRNSRIGGGRADLFPEVLKG